VTSRIWQKARVTGSRAGYLTLQFAAPEACRRCRQSRGCGGGLFGAWLGSSAPIVEVAAGDSVRVGDWVRVGFDTTFLVRAALRVYGLPLVAFLLGPAWHGAVVPLQILAPGIFLRLSFQVPDAIAAATGAVYPSAWRQGLYAAAVLVGAVTGQHWGLPGVAAGGLRERAPLGGAGLGSAAFQREQRQPPVQAPADGLALGFVA